MRAPILTILGRSAARAAIRSMSPRARRAAVRVVEGLDHRVLLGRVGLVRYDDVVEAVQGVDAHQCAVPCGWMRPTVSAWAVMTPIDYEYSKYERRS